MFFKRMMFICFFSFYLNSYIYSAAFTNNENRSVPPVHLTLLDNVFQNVYQSFFSSKIFYHLATVPLTYVLVHYDQDYKIHAYAAKKPGLDSWFSPVVYTGTYAPLILASYLYLRGRNDPDGELLGASYSILQSALITVVYVSMLKVIMGRPNPDNSQSDIRSFSRVFRYFKGGIVKGWPSGHTANTVTTATALIYYYPGNTWVKIGGYLAMAYTFSGVCLRRQGQMHWFSDAVAGALFGYAIGATVGDYYHRTVFHKRDKNDTLRFHISPVINMSSVGFNMQYCFN